MMTTHKNQFNGVFSGRRVLVTGHTGFKGSWLCHWLRQMGASVTGIAIDVPTEPSHFQVTEVAEDIVDIRADVRNAQRLEETIQTIAPDFVFHLAAQALVKRSYADPVETFSTNVLGTANVLNALRSLENKCVAVFITSDKCYDNVEWVWGYRETDRLGGTDPYSASKGAAELVIRSFVESYCRTGAGSNLRIGIGRAGNVIGGGDWAPDRLVPDCIKSWAKREHVSIRSPGATRPWQHVLEPLSGYLHLAQSLYSEPQLHGEAFNFGPDGESINTVRAVLDELSTYTDSAQWEDVSDGEHAHEAGLLKLNCDKALALLGWKATLNFNETIRMTADWYRAYQLRSDTSMRDVTLQQLNDYCALASDRGRPWAV